MLAAAGLMQLSSDGMFDGSRPDVRPPRSHLLGVPCPSTTAKRQNEGPPAPTPEQPQCCRVAVLHGSLWFLIGFTLLLGLGPATGQMPTGWQDLDIGSPAVAGAASGANGTWTVAGGGADIGGTADQFNFAYQVASSYAVMGAQVLTQPASDGWAKAGVMMRDNDTAAAMFAAVFATPANGVNFVWRSATAGTSAYAEVAGFSTPVWVKLVRSANVFTAYYGPDGQTWTQLGPPQTIPLNGLPLAGLAVTAHNNAALGQATFNSVTLSNLPPPAPPALGVYRQLWTNLNASLGNTLTALTNSAYNTNWPNSPDLAHTQIFTNFETEVNSGLSYYGQRVRALVVPPTNGNYVFWIASDDNSDLFVSTNENPANEILVANVSSWTPARSWLLEASQQSAPIYLQAGRRYYLEALMQQGTGGDNLAVQWQLPNGQIEQPMTAVSPAGTWLIPYDGSITKPGIYLQSGSLTVTEGQNPNLFVLCTNRAALNYRWRLSSTNLTGAAFTNTTLTLSNVTIAANNGQVYTCVITNTAGAVTSAPIPLTVLVDNVPPSIQSAANSGPTNLLLVFTKPLEAASATNTANYVFTNGLPVSRALLATDTVSVTLTTAPLVYGSNYLLVINNVRDRARLPNPVAANTTLRFQATPLISQDIGSPPVGSAALFGASNSLTLNAYGTDIGGIADQCGFEYQTRTGDFDVGVCVAALSATDVAAKAGLMARESLAANGRFAAALATPAMAGTVFAWRDPSGSLANALGSFPANYPNTWLRLKRAGNVFTGFAGYDGTNWAQLGATTISMPAQLYLGLAASSHGSTAPAVAQFVGFTNVTSALTAVAINPHEPLGPCSRLTPLVISEIMYKPAPRTDTNNVEFLELYNTNPYFEDISGFQLVGNSMSYTFPPGTVMGAGAFLVIAASPPGLRNVYGLTNVLGPYTGSLKKSDTLQLLDDTGAILLTVPYSDVYPWPVAAHGSGHSLVLANPTYGEGDPRAWDISDVVGGSPGAGEAFRPDLRRNVVINEVLAHSENAAVPQFIELYDHSPRAVDLSGCVLTDDPSTNRFVIPAGTTVGAGGFAAFSQSQLGFVLDGSGGTVYLVKPDGSRVLDAFPYAAQADGVSCGRWPDGANAFYPLAAQTPGTNNSGAWLGNIVINELMYDPISGNDDDQYIELYNRGTNTVSLANWQFTAGVSFTFPPAAALGPDSYLVVGLNVSNLLAKYTNLNAGNTLGNYGGKLSHKGERVALALPQTLTTAGPSGPTITTIYVVEDEVTYGTGGRWGQWAHGGGSSLELINPNTNHRLAYNWADSDETSKSVWTNLEYTGVLDNGANYTNGPIDQVQVGLLDVGECLVDNLEVLPGGTTGANLVANGTFESGLANWTVQGDHMRSSLEPATGLGGYQSSQALHLRSSDSFWTLGDYAQGALTQTSLGAGQTATLRLKARWLRGWPEILMRLRGNWLEVTGALPIPPNPGTPGLRNSTYVANAGPAIYEVNHSPPLPAANTPVVVTARFHDPHPLQAILLYRIDTAVSATPTYTAVPMLDNGTGGDALAHDGLYSATIPAQAAGTVVAFLVQAGNAFGATNIFPARLNNNAAVPRECVVGFGDTVPAGGSFSHHHVFLTQNWAQLWGNWGGVSHELFDGTWVDGGGRIVYNWSGRYAGSPYHQYTGSPVTTVGGMHWQMPEDDLVFGTSSFNKQHVPGNGPLDDDTLQREQISYWMAHRIGLPRSNRRYYASFVNGVRHAPLMEDAQVPDSAMLNELWPNDHDGVLYKCHSWFEGDLAEQSGGYMNFDNKSLCLLDKFTTTINGVANQYKLARYRWMWWIRQFPDTANNFSQVYALMDAANTPTTSPAYYTNMEAQVDTEEWLRLSAMEHATGDWDSFFTQNQWNMYNYKPTFGKWTALKWDWNITLGSGTQSWPSDGSMLFTYGGGDANMAAFHNYPPYQRAYLRALQDIASLAMNNPAANPVLDAKFAAFAANGLTQSAASGVQVADPAAANGLENWIGSMHNSILTALTNHGVANVPFAILSTNVTNDVAFLTGTAPLPVKTVWFNGVTWPVLWTTITNWTAQVPLVTGTNRLSVVGVDLHNRVVAGATNNVAVVYKPTAPSPLGQVTINEIMYRPLVPGADYVELYNNSLTNTFDLSGWSIPFLAYTFPAGAFIAPGGFLVLAGNPSAYAAAYGGTAPPFDTYSGTLSGGGGPLILMRPAGGMGTNPLVAGVRFGNAAPWPVNAGGSGHALQLVDPRQDPSRVCNWAVGLTNRGILPAQWTFVSTNVPATASRFYLYLGSAGDIYLDDVSIVGTAGTNLLANGGFESPLAATNWNLTANFTNSSLSTTLVHSGSSSLHLIATAAGTGSGNAVYQDVPGVVIGSQSYYTISLWYYQTTNGNPLIARFGSSLNPLSVNPAPQPAPSQPPATPNATNSVLATLATFPALWLNEVQPNNLTGITNRAGQPAPWIELYNSGTNTLSLSNLYLANSYTNLSQWPFPAGATIAPGQFQVIFADGQTGLSTNGEWHTSFALAGGSGSVALSFIGANAQIQVLDYIDYTNLPANYSYGSFPDGQCLARQAFFRPTPSGTNDGTPASFIAYATEGSLYSQDFNTLPNPGATSVNTANPAVINGATYSLGNPFDFAMAPAGSGFNGGLGLQALAGWFGLADPTASVGTRFGATDGDQTTGGQISFGPPNSANRALGLLATRSTGFTAFGARFLNTSSNTLNRMNLQFTGELWRQSNLPKTLTFAYYIDRSGMGAFWTNITAVLPTLEVAFPTSAAAVGGVAMDGTQAINQSILAVTGQVITNWPPGAALWLVWTMADPAGKAQGLAIDNLRFSAFAAPTNIAPVQATIATGNVGGSSLSLSWPSLAGYVYRVQYRDDLSLATWTNLGTDQPGTGLPLSLSLSLTNAPRRFYRIVVLP